MHSSLPTWTTAIQLSSLWLYGGGTTALIDVMTTGTQTTLNPLGDVVRPVFGFDLACVAGSFVRAGLKVLAVELPQRGISDTTQ